MVRTDEPVHLLAPCADLLSIDDLQATCATSEDRAEGRRSVAGSVKKNCGTTAQYSISSDTSETNSTSNDSSTNTCSTSNDSSVCICSTSNDISTNPCSMSHEGSTKTCNTSNNGSTNNGIINNCSSINICSSSNDDSNNIFSTNSDSRTSVCSTAGSNSSKCCSNISNTSNDSTGNTYYTSNDSRKNRSPNKQCSTNRRVPNINSFSGSRINNSFTNTLITNNDYKNFRNTRKNLSNKFQATNSCSNLPSIASLDSSNDYNTTTNISNSTHHDDSVGSITNTSTLNNIGYRNTDNDSRTSANEAEHHGKASIGGTTYGSSTAMNRLPVMRNSSKAERTKSSGRGVGVSGNTNNTSCSSCRSSHCVSTLRMLVLGAHGVGKSATVVRFLTQRFIGEYRSGVDILYRQALRQNNQEQLLEIIDVSTRPGNCSVPLAEVQAADCLLVVYSITDRGTLDHAQQLLLEVNHLTHLTRPPVTLLANKLDQGEHREISREEGEVIAARFDCAFSEVSAMMSSQDIMPVFLHLIHSVNSKRSTTCCCAQRVPVKGDSSMQRSVSPSMLRRLAGSFRDTESEPDDHAPRTSSPTGSTGHFTRQTSFQQCGEKLRSSRNYFFKPKEESMCSQRCRSFDEALNLSKMEVFEWNPAKDNSRSSKSRYSSPKKMNKPKQMPTGRSKSRKTKNTPPLRSLDTRLVRNDDMQFSNAEKCLSSPVLTPSENEKDTERIVKKLRHHGDSNMPVYMSRSVDHNLQKYITNNGEYNKDSKTNKYPHEGKPLTLLQRGRSFIQEAKDKHWKEKDLRLSFRNLSSRNDSLKHERPHSCSRSPLPISPSRPLRHRPKDLPTGGKTWVSRSEGDDDRCRFLDVLKHSRTSSISGTGDSSSTSSRVSPTIYMEDDRGAAPFMEATGDRHRKFSVFSRTLGNFLSRGSMPDLPRATATLYDKFDSFKKSIKKLSV